MVVVFELNGTKFMALNVGPYFKFTPANSYVITCHTQEEIDRYWEKHFSFTNQYLAERAFSRIIRFKDLASEEFLVAEHEANKIMHIVFPIGKTVLMANDVPEILGRLYRDIWFVEL